MRVLLCGGCCCWLLAILSLQAMLVMRVLLCGTWCWLPAVVHLPRAKGGHVCCPVKESLVRDLAGPILRLQPGNNLRDQDACTLQLVIFNL